MSIVSLNQQTSNLAQRLSRMQPGVDDSLARLSSGSRLVRPADDPIGVGIAARYDAQQKRLEAASVNLQNGASRLQTTDSLLSGLGGTLLRMSELATLSSNAVQNSSDRAVYATEFKALQTQLRSIVGGTTGEIGGTSDLVSPQGTFQGRALFGPAPSEREYILAGVDADNRIMLPEINLRQGSVLAALSQDAAGEFTLQLDAPGSVGVLKAALEQVAESRASVGGAQSRLDFASSTIVTAMTNGEAALSRILDTNVATETTQLARRQMISEAHTAMLAQAREVPRKLLPLLSSN